MTDAVINALDTDSTISDADNTNTVISLSDFVADFGHGLLDNVERAYPARYQHDNLDRDMVMQSLKRIPFDAQADVVQAISALLIDDNAPAGIINAEMGTGKTMMAIAVTAVLYAEKKANRILVLSPPHLVYR
jgi:RecG-like helicase